MAKKKVFIKLEESKSSGYVSVDSVRRDEEELKEKYQEKKRIYSEHNLDTEPFEEFKNEYYHITVEYDGRSNLSKPDILKTMDKKGIIKKIGEGGVLGGYYKLT